MLDVPERILKNFVGEMFRVTIVTLSFPCLAVEPRSNVDVDMGRLT